MQKSKNGEGNSARERGIGKFAVADVNAGDKGEDSSGGGPFSGEKRLKYEANVKRLLLDASRAKVRAEIRAFHAEAKAMKLQKEGSKDTREYLQRGEKIGITAIEANGEGEVARCSEGEPAVSSVKNPRKYDEEKEEEWGEMENSVSRNEIQPPTVEDTGVLRVGTTTGSKEDLSPQGRSPSFTSGEQEWVSEKSNNNCDSPGFGGQRRIPLPASEFDNGPYSPPARPEEEEKEETDICSFSSQEEGAITFVAGNRKEVAEEKKEDESDQTNVISSATLRGSAEEEEVVEIVQRTRLKVKEEEV